LVVVEIQRGLGERSHHVSVPPSLTDVRELELPLLRSPRRNQLCILAVKKERSRKSEQVRYIYKPVYLYVSHYRMFCGIMTSADRA